MLNWRWIARSGVLLGSAIALTACGGGASESASEKISGPIPIGIGVAQTSNVALLGQEQVTGAELAEAYFNEAGGINGTPVKLVFQDTAGDEAGAINAFQTLINKDKVVGVLGPTLSQQAFSADPIANRAKVPVLGPSNTANGIPQIGPYVGRVSAPVSVVAPNALETALKLKPDIQKVAVFYAQNDAFSKTETEIFQATVKDKGLDLVTVQKFQTTDTDFQTQATAAMNLKPDLAIISGLAADGGNLVRQLRELGYQGLIIGGNGLNTSNMFPVCKSFCDGVLIAQAYNPKYDGAVNQDFLKAYKAQYQGEPPQFTAQAFTGVQVFVESLQAIAEQEAIAELSIKDLREKLNEQIRAQPFETPLGQISITEEGEIEQQNFFVAQIKMSSDGNTGSFEFLE